MVQKKRSYKKKSYKRRYYKRRYYKRRYYKRRYPKPIKKPEIHITENQLGQNAFNNSTYGMGLFNNLTVISGSSQNDKDAIEYKLNNPELAELGGFGGTGSIASEYLKIVRLVDNIKH